MTNANNNRAKRAAQYIAKFVGLPYIWGGDDPVAGFDCSGLALEMLKMAGFVRNDFDTTANGLWKMYQDKRCGSPGPGVLVLYGTAKKATHVAVFVDDYYVVEAGGGGSKVQSREDAIRLNGYVRKRPWNYRRDFLGFINPWETE